MGDAEAAPKLPGGHPVIEQGVQKDDTAARGLRVGSIRKKGQQSADGIAPGLPRRIVWRVGFMGKCWVTSNGGD